MQTVSCHIDTGAGLNHGTELLIHFEWNDCKNRDKKPIHEQPHNNHFHTNSKKLLHFRFSAICAWVWLGIVFNRAVKTLLGNSVIDHFIRAIFDSKRKVVPWLFSAVAISVSPKHSKSSNPKNVVVNTLIGDIVKTDIQVTKMPTPIRIERLVHSQPHTECHVMVTTSASRIYTVEPRILEATDQLTFATQWVIDIQSLQPFQNRISNLSAKTIHLPKHMVLAYVTEPPKSVATP